MLFGAEFGNEALKNLVDALGAVVRDERLWDSKPSEHVSFVKTEKVVRGDFREGFGLYPLGEIFYGHSDAFILECSLYERSEDVHSPPGKWPQGR